MRYLMIASMDCTQNTSNPSLLSTWFWDPSEPEATRVLAMCTHNADKSVSSTRYAAHDLPKSVSALFDASGTRQATFEYTPYGETLTAEGAWASSMPFCYSSEYRDEDLGLIYYNYRHYNPQDGRWISRDPIGEKGGVHLYRFVLSNPVNIFDVVGLSCNGTDYFTQEADLGRPVFGFFDPSISCGAINKEKLDELYKAVEEANSIKDKCGNKCYIVYVKTEPISADAIKALPWGNDRAILMSHSTGYPDDFHIHLKYYYPIPNRDLQPNVDVIGCHLQGDRKKGKPGGANNLLGELVAINKLIEKVKSLKEKDCCVKMESVLLVSGDR